MVRALRDAAAPRRREGTATAVVGLDPGPRRGAVAVFSGTVGGIPRGPAAPWMRPRRFDPGPTVPANTATVLANGTMAPLTRRLKRRLPGLSGCTAALLLGACVAAGPPPGDDRSAVGLPPTRTPAPASGSTPAPAPATPPAATRTTPVATPPGPGPVHRVVETLEGTASYYADSLAGRRTASGVPYRPEEMVAAHRHLPFGTRLRVENVRNGRVVELTVVDRGPFTRGRILDVSRRAAEKLDFTRHGTTRVRIEVLEPGPGGHTRPDPDTERGVAAGEGPSRRPRSRRRSASRPAAPGRSRRPSPRPRGCGARASRPRGP
jgi:rare lipoprotein A